MSLEKQKKNRAIRQAAMSVAMEMLEERRLLTSCGIAGSTIQVFGNNSTGNNIVLSYNSGGVSVTVTDSVAGTTNCTNIDATSISSIEVYGGETSTATSTGDDTIDGSSMPDTIQLRLSGLDGDDSILGGEAADSIFGGDDEDTLFGNDHNDTIFGGDDNDSIDGGFNDDSLLGEGGNDVIVGAGDNDTINGGDGNDTLGSSAGRRKGDIPTY